MEELFDIYTRQGDYLGVEKKSICHSKNPSFYHKPVWVWIINDKKEILVQKRADCKKVDPNKWDFSSAGHVRAGESILLGAIRETYEELGIKTKENDYLFLDEYIMDETFEIGQIYLLKKNINISNFKLKKDEVAEVKWLTWDSFKKLFYSNDFSCYPDNFKDMMIKKLRTYLN